MNFTYPLPTISVYDLYNTFKINVYFCRLPPPPPQKFVQFLQFLLMIVRNFDPIHVLAAWPIQGQCCGMSVWPPSQAGLLSLLTKEQSNKKIMYRCNSTTDLIAVLTLYIYHLVHYRACLALQCTHQEVFVPSVILCWGGGGGGGGGGFFYGAPPPPPPSPTSELKGTPASRKRISTRNKRSNAISLSTLYQDEEEDAVRFPGDEDPDFVNTTPFKARKKQKRY